jgi:hypothetical protein
MDPRLKAILQKAKAIDERAKKYDNVDASILESNVTTRQTMVSESPSVKSVKPNVGGEDYKQKVKESKLPLEIQRAMLENPIPQPDAPGMFSLDEEEIREINPNYGMGSGVNESLYSEDDEIDFTQHRKPVQRRIVEEVNTPKQKGINENVIRKMIAEEIAKALPSIVEKYFDKKMIQENVKMLKTLTNKVKRVQ